MAALLLLALSQPPLVVRANTPVLRGHFSGMMLDPARPRLYVMNSSGDSIAVLNTSSNKEIANVWVGPGPSGMDISADGAELYVAVSGEKYLAVVNLTSLTVAGDIQLPAKPTDVAAGRLGRAYVTTSANHLLVVDTNTSSVIDSVTSSSDLARISPDREFLYVGLRGLDPSSISKFSVATDNVHLISTVPFDTIGENLGDFAVSPDGSRLYVASGWPYYVIVVNSSDWSSVGALQTGPYPSAVSLDASGGLALASHPPGGITLFNTTTFLPVRTYNATSESSLPSYVALSSDGSSAYVKMGGPPYGPMYLELINTSAPGSLSAPTISLSPSSGVMGSTVTINGTSLVASHAVNATYASWVVSPPGSGGSCGVVCLTYMPLVLSGNCTTSSTGSLGGCTFTVPSMLNSLDEHIVIVSDGTDTLNATFGILIPHFRLSTSSGTVGSTVTITGSGLIVSHSLIVEWDYSTAGMPTTCTTDASGAISSGCTFTVPTSVLGPHTVTVSDSTYVLNATFTVITRWHIVLHGGGSHMCPRMIAT